MNITKKKLINKVCAILMIMALTISDFLFVGKTVFTYAIDVVATNHANVDFSAYFLNENGEKVDKLEGIIDSGEKYLYVDISVKNEGYLNGTICLNENNFVLKQEKLSENIAEISEKEVKLNQINAGSTVTIKLGIEPVKENIVNQKMLDTKTNVELQGQYVNSKNVENEKYVDIKGTAGVAVNWKSSENAKAELGAEILTNSIYEIDGAQKRIVQILVNSKITDNNYPVKSTEINLNVPEEVEDVKVHARSTKATTNTDFNENNYVYNHENNKLTVKLSNEDANNISWNKNVQDTVVVTYIFDKDQDVLNKEISVESKIHTYDEKELMSNQNVHIEKEIDGIVSYSAENTEDIYKGKIYTGEEKDYIVKSKIDIDYANILENITIKGKKAKYQINEEEIEANIEYKETKINKNEFLKIFGEDGYITIKNEQGTIIGNINKESETDENGKVVIKYGNGIQNIELITSKPQTVGTLNIETTKTILNTNHSREQKERITGIKEKAEINNKEIIKEITLKETETEASVSLDVTKFSTVAEKQTVTLEATLLANDESKDLYKNPNVTIKFPKEIKVLSAQYASLYKNGLEVENTSINQNENGEYQINIKFKGEQEKYDSTEGTKICLKVELKTNELTPTKKSSIEMIYTNENKNQSKTKNIEIEFESQYGLMLYNQIKNYNSQGDTVVTTDSETAYGELNTNAEKRDININTALINNYGQTIKDITLIGKIPSQETEESFKTKLNNIQTNNDKAKVYYSPKADADKNDKSWEDNIENAASYKIVIDEMKEEEVIQLNTEVSIPENLKHNEKGTFSSTINYNYQNNNKTNTSNIVLLTQTNMSEEGKEVSENQKTENGLDVEITTLVGNDNISNNDNINEGQTIRYKIKITNNTGKDYSNVTVSAKQTNGYVWDLVETEGHNPYYNTDVKENFYEISKSNDIKLGTIENLKNGESYTYEYESSTYLLNDENINGTETFGTISINSEDNQLNEKVTTIKNNIQDAELQVNIFNGSSNEMQLPSGGTIKSLLSLRNITDKALNDIEVKIAFSDNLDPDVSLVEENEEKVSIETEDDNNKTTTLKISSIEANETIEIELYPSSKDSLGKEKSADVWILAEATTLNKNNYISNKLKRTVTDYTRNIKLEQQGEYEDGKLIDIEKDKISNGDTIQFVATITNNEIEDINTDIEYHLDKMIDVQSAKILTTSGEEDVIEEMEYNDLSMEEQTIKPGEKVSINIVGNVDTEEIESITNSLKVFDNEKGRISDNDLTISVNKVNEYEEQEEDKNKPDDNNENPDTPDTPNVDPEENKYTISGTAWIDKDKDGKRSSSEEKASGITVDAMNSENGDIVASTKTDTNGVYRFDLSEGKYIIIFYYDNNLYTTTTYQVNGANDGENSDAVGREINIKDKTVTAGTTDILDLNRNMNNIDIGLVLRNTFDLKVNKYVNKITVTNNSKTTTYQQKDNTKLAKAEIKAKNINGSLVVIEYKIKVTNVGDVAGYARNVVDYMPSSLSFNSSLNSDWYLSGENLYNTSLANTEIKPGETKELTLVLTKTMTESNTGLINNKASINESSNLLGIKDETDDIGSADVIISVSTGTLVNYLATTMITLAALIGLAIFVNKKYLNKRI